MRAFARLLDDLVYTQSRTGKLALLERYFRATPDPDRGWALAALTDGLPLRVQFRRVLAELMATRVDPVLYQLSRDYVGDTAETVALLWPEPRTGPSASLPPPTPADMEEGNPAGVSCEGENQPLSLAKIVDAVRAAHPSALGPLIARTLDGLDVRERWAFLKLLGGAPRVGVSARLAKTAVAALGGRDVAEIEEVWHAVSSPYTTLFQWLVCAGPQPAGSGRPSFRPLMLAHPFEDADWAGFAPEDFAAEWKWDGIRVQVAAAGGEVRIFSRTGDDISHSFPEIASAFAGRDVTVDGELLVVRDGVVAPFNDLQQRLNRKTVAARALTRYPAHVRLYDLLFDGDADLRGEPFTMRRSALEAWHTARPPPLTDVSALVPFATLPDLAAIRAGARATGIEGLMLKRRASPYLPGRPRGHWFKWKRDPLTLDCVLMYAQRGSGKRSSLYSDYTFGVWKVVPTAARGGASDGLAEDISASAAGGAGDVSAVVGGELVPVGKAYSGFTDAELKALDKFIRDNTTESFGPVRAVRPVLVLEVAFDAVQPSARHKSGVAMRFPRIHRIRWDKPAHEADTLGTVAALMGTSGLIVQAD